MAKKFLCDILIIEDNEATNLLIQKKLSKFDYKIISALSGQAALKLLQNSQPKLLITDHYLQDMTSFELIAQLSERNLKIPYIVMTGNGDEQVAVQTMKSGAEDYLIKSHQFLELLPEVVNRTLSEINARKRLKAAEEQVTFLSSITRQISESIIVTDTNFKITFVNTAAAQMYGTVQSALIGSHFSILLPNVQKGLLESIHTTVTDHFTWYGDIMGIRKDGSQFTASNTIAPYYNLKKEIVSFIISQKNLDELIESARIRLNTINELKEALSKIKRLQGLIPICAKCKKIRDDDGYWQELELYIQEHSEADFTHGLCPDCIRELYPETYKKLKDQGKVTWE